MGIALRQVDVGGLTMRIAEDGPPDGPVVLLCHGFPESWYSWRHQLPALADAGYHAVAPDMRGYGERLLAAVFSLRDEKNRKVYWIYNFKRGAFYPFVPAGGAQQRDNERELRLKAQIGADLPVEAELERWFPLWGAPL